MSRRVSPSLRPRVHGPLSDVASYQTVPSTSALYNPIVKYGSNHRGGHHYHSYCPPSETEPPTFSEVHSYYEYSDSNSSSRLPYYDDLSIKKQSRHTYTDRTPSSRRYLYASAPPPTATTSVAVPAIKDIRRVYPGTTTTVIDGPSLAVSSMGSRRSGPVSRLSDRAHTPASSGGGSATVDGCGGHCVAFESVCYYLLQVALTMGVLIGASLCIAGAVLRRSRARDLQVLMYIGALVALVSAFLLVIQYTARKEQRQRRKHIRAAHRAIPLLPVNHQPCIVVQQDTRSARVNLVDSTEHQGVPWWRRDEIMNRV